MKTHELKKDSALVSRKRLGRGISAGGGMTAGRGTKGQRSRSGFNLPRKFEGGQTPLIMRLHKMPGFKSYRPKSKVINLADLSQKFKNGEIVSMKTLVEKGMIKKGEQAKILFDGKLTVKVIPSDVPASKKAVEEIEKFKLPESKPKTVKGSR